jgi:hypothetical protein
MSDGAAERRRHRRVPIVRDLPETTLPVSATVQVLDISETGVLLASTQPLDIGRRAHLRTRLGSEPLAVQVEIKRLLPSLKHTSTAYRMGAAFVELDDDTRRKLETFLRGQT